MNATNATYTLEIITRNANHILHRYTGGWALFNMLKQVQHLRLSHIPPVIVMISKNGILKAAFNSKGA